MLTGRSSRATTCGSAHQPLRRYHCNFQLVPSRSVQSCLPRPAATLPHAVPGRIVKPKLSYIGVSSAADGVSVNTNTWCTKVEAKMKRPTLSKSDEEFLKVGVEFMTTKDELSIVELNDLFEKVGFPRRDPERLKIALENTHRMVWIRSVKQSRFARLGQLLGFARATSDGVLSATIWDVAVLPSWQRTGLGRALMERMLCLLVDDGIPTITLYAEPNVVSLYEKLGFAKDPEGIKGMAFLTKRKDSRFPLLR